MLKIFCIGHFKSDIFQVEIEVDISRGIHRFDIIGLGDKAVGESKSRIVSAIKNSGYKLNKTTKRITVLLSPAHKKKEGSHFDLAIAILCLEKSGVLEKSLTADPDETFYIFGELSLEGRVKYVPKCTEYLFHAQKLGFNKFIVPLENKTDIALLSELYQDSTIFYTSSLKETVSILNGEYSEQSTGKIKENTLTSLEQQVDKGTPFDFAIDKVRGQEHVKRALQIALAGNHHIFILGMPGTGKTMIAHAVEDLLPREPIGNGSSHKSTFKARVSEILTRTGSECSSLIKPHHTISYANLIGSKDKPGSLRELHRGILIMDEWAEFDRRTLESLRQPLEEGFLFGETTDFICIATANPCPCGYFNSRVKKCTCTKNQLDGYRKKIFGPTSQRFDVAVITNELEHEHSSFGINQRAVEKIKGKTIKDSIYKTRQVQNTRLANIVKSINEPSSLTRKQIRLKLVEFIYKNMNQPSLKCYEEIIAKHKLNQRLFDSLLLVSQTIADIEGGERIEPVHLFEAINYTFRYQ